MQRSRYINENFDSLLKINGTEPSQGRVYAKRLARIEEAKQWPVGSYDEKIYTTLFSSGMFSVCLGKPGKEATRQSGYKGKDLNLYDMRPEIFVNSQHLDKAATFGEIVAGLEKVVKRDRYAVELMATLFYRSAFLLDHVLCSDGNYRYSPPQAVVDYIDESLDEVLYELPPSIFLHYMDAIALNEDVKYYSKGRDLSKENIGGKNTLLTFVKVIAVITQDLPLSIIAAPLLMSGVSPISLAKAREVLPHIGDKTIGPTPLIPSPDDFLPVPIVGSVSCGEPIMAEQNIEDYIDVPAAKILSDQEYFLLRARGDSMDKMGIIDGSLVLCKSQNTAENGDIVVALINDEATIKEFHKTNVDILLRPKSNNPAHQDMHFSSDVQIQGKFCEVLNI